MAESIFDLGSVDKDELAFIAWRCENDFGSSEALQSALKRLGFGDSYVQEITSGSDLSIFHFGHPIFSMARVNDYFKVPEQIRKLCDGPIDGFYSDTDSGDGTKRVCRYIVDDYILFFCFGRPHEAGKSDSEFSSWEFHALVLKDGESWFVGSGGDSNFFKDVYAVVGPLARKSPSPEDIVKLYDMEAAVVSSPLNYC
jgi:hypothetical protein